MFYLGLDVHSKWMTVRGFDPATGEFVEKKKLSNETEALQAVFARLPGPLYGVMEAGTNAWAMYRTLQPFFARLVVAHPADLWNRRTDRGAKTDRRDAMRMAEMLYRGEVKGLYIPDERTQDLRVLVRAKVRASRWATRLTNELGSLLRAWGYIGPRRLLGKKGKARLEEAQVPPHSARVLKVWAEMLQKVQELEAELEAAIKAEAAREPACSLLQTLPTVGAFTALLVRAEVGEIGRFPDGKALVSYAGLAPRVYQSGDRCAYGKLGPWGNRWLRYGLGLLAQRIARSRQDSDLHRLYWRICLRRDKKSAKMAVARKATHYIFHLLSHQEVWQPTEERLAA